MKKNEDRKKARQRVERKVWTIAVLIFVSTICLGYGGVMYAKYYSQGYEKGVAVASAIYFSANHATEVTVGDTDEKYVPSFVIPSEEAGGYTFTFDVRNYENNLLFNDSGIRIPYKVSFWLGEAATASSYAVCIGDSNYKTFDDVNMAVFGSNEAPQILDGGVARSDTYTIKVDVSSEEHVRIPVFVEVETLSGSPIDRVLRGQMIFGNVVFSENFIEKQQFMVDGNITDDAVWFAELEKQAALTYEIRTVGTATGTGDAETVKLSWDPSVFEIDLYDAIYNKWLSKAGNATGPTIEENGWYSITLEVVPYSAENVTFFRGNSYNSKIVNVTNMTSKSALYQYIKAEKVTTGN